VIGSKFPYHCTCLDQIPINGSLAESSSSLIASCPPLYLLEICSSILNGSGSGSDSDKDLLHSFSNLLTAIVGSRQDLSYVRRLKDFSSVLVDAVAASGAAVKRRRTNSSEDSFSQPLSRFHAFRDQISSRQMETSHSDGGHVYTGSLGLDSQYSVASEFAFPHWDKSTTLKTPTNSRDGDIHFGPTYEHIGIEEDYSEELFSYLASLNDV
jgi:hypothetical protein